MMRDEYFEDMSLEDLSKFLANMKEQHELSVKKVELTRKMVIGLERLIEEKVIESTHLMGELVFPYSRSQMMTKEVDYDTYMRQFVTSDVLSWVKDNITVERIQQSNDHRYFNDIPMEKWMAFKETTLFKAMTRIIKRKNVDECYGSDSDAVSLAKAAARVLVETRLT